MMGTNVFCSYTDCGEEKVMFPNNMDVSQSSERAFVIWEDIFTAEQV